MINLLYLAVFVTSCFLTYLIRHYALKKSLLDVPNARSSHSQPTPRGGGLAIVLTVAVFLLGLQISGLIDLTNRTAIAILAAGAAIAAIGFWDDHQPIPARWRLLVHLLATSTALCFLPNLPPLPLFGFDLDLAGFGVIFYTLALVWLLNLYNFMDGIDGIASSEFISVTVNAALLLVLNNQGDSYEPLLFIAAAVAGFWVWNWPSGKIFMGDVGSGFLGFALGIFALLTALYHGLTVWNWLILLAFFVADASFTLAKRFLNGQVWYAAHCSHAYQRYAKSLIEKFSQQGLNATEARRQSHQQINVILLIINTFWLLPLAAAAMFYPFWGALLTVMAYMPLIYIAFRLKAGHSA